LCPPRHYSVGVRAACVACPFLAVAFPKAADAYNPGGTRGKKYPPDPHSKYY